MISQDDVTEWLSENLMLGAEEQNLIEVLNSQGIEGSALVREVRTRLADPLFAAGRRIAQRLRKLESMLAIQAELRLLAPSATLIERRAGLSGEEFLESYYAPNRPVILTDLLEGSPAIEKWSPKYFAQKWGNEQVQVMVGRNDDPDYEINMEQHKKTMLLATFCQMVEQSKGTNDFYLVANNFLLENSEFKSLFEDIRFPDKYLDSRRTAKNCSLWFGPAGTATKPHFDLVNVLLAQVIGRKQITMIAPCETPCVYNQGGVYSEVDWDAPDLSRFPRFAEAHPLEIVLSPREALFIPIGWWHWVRSLDISISIAFLNFIHPNEFSAHDLNS